jgi:arginine/lysine/ornithine decarboxylase
MPRTLQDNAPIAEGIADAWERDQLSFAIPAHCGGIGPVAEIALWAGEQVIRADLAMSHAVDTRDRRLGLQQQAQDLFAEAVGAKETKFSTNGSSMSVHVALTTVAPPGATVAVARNSHKSAFAGLVLSGARPVYIEPVHDEELELAHPPRVEDVAAALDADPCAVFIATPSYYGVAADVRAIADLVHERDLPLVTDDAWGLDASFVSHDQLPASALAQGADLAIGSVHKTLSGLSQTSVLSVGSDRIDSERLGLCFELEESTSASTLLLASIDAARRQFVRDGDTLIDRALVSAARLREALAQAVPELDVVDTVALERHGEIDPTHVLIDVRGAGLTGYQADDWLREERAVDVELVDHRRLMPLVTWAHGEEHIERFVSALRDMVDAIGGGEPGLPRLPGLDEVRAEQRMIPRDAFFATTEHVGRDKAPGRVSAELITPYPPGVPLVAPGEVITPAIVEHLAQFLGAGGFVEGAADQSLETFRVVA